MNRRDFFRLAAGATPLAWMGCASASRSPSPAPDFTMAYLTDPHVHGQQGAGRATALAFEHAMSQTPRPQRLITGGDLAFDVLETDKAAADAQFDLLDRALASVDVPIHHTLGNHDLLGVDEASGMDPGHPFYGKKYFLERFGLERSYGSFDHEHWHFVILDTMEIVGRHYRGWVDDEQLAWLEDDLARADRPTVVIGHIPLFSNFIEWRQGTAEGIADTVSVVNSHQVAEVLARHPVKLVLAGHLHVNETYLYQGITFANVGAVSGNWWRGLRDGFEEGYAILEFRGDRVDWRYVDYGWQAEPEASA